MAETINTWRYDLEDFDLLNAMSEADVISKSACADYAKSDVPPEIDYRAWLRIEDQLPIGSCQGNSLATSGEIVIYLETGEILQLTRMGAYIWTQELDGINGDEGSTVRNGLNVITKGLCLEKFWTYPQRYTRQPPAPGTRQEAEANRVYSVVKFFRMTSPDDVITWVESNQGPLHIGISWLSSLSGAGPIVENYSGRSAGGHSVTIAGYKKLNGDTCPRLINSHSIRWADKGTTLLKRRVLDGMFSARYTTMWGMTTAKGIVAPRWDYIARPVTR
jgi:hypothetical protein